jgi:hypothetical protein
MIKPRFCIGVFSVIFLLFSGSLAQEKVRTVDNRMYRMYDVKTEPIEIVSRQVGDKPFINSTQVNADNEWLRDLTFGVKNISGKTIKEFEIQVIIPQQGGMAYPAALTAWYSSRNPAQKPEKKQAGQNGGEEGLAAGDVVTVKVVVGRMLEDIKKQGVEDIERVYLSFGRVVFDDGTAWYQGIPMRQDPNTPGRFFPTNRPNPQ